MLGEGQHRKTMIAGLCAALLLVLFVMANSYRLYQDTHRKHIPFEELERERMPEEIGFVKKQLALHDFESGNAGDPAAHLASVGHGGRQSLKMSPQVPFSPGLWIKFKDINPPGQAWIRAAGYVWFSGPPADVAFSLVATCNQKGVNFKYMFIPSEMENLKPNQWNRVSIDYRIPRAPDGEDVLQAYFWYRGKGEMLVDDIVIDYFTPAVK